MAPAATSSAPTSPATSNATSSSSSSSEAGPSTAAPRAQKAAARVSANSDASPTAVAALVTPRKAKVKVSVVDATPDGKATSDAGSVAPSASGKPIPRTSAAGAILTGGYNSHKVYIGNLPETATLEDLEDCFSQLGKCVCSIKRGFGFVEYEESSAASEAVAKYHEGHFLGAQIKVELSHARAPPHKDSGAPLDGSPGGTGCYICGSSEHWARDCPEIESGMLPVRNPPGSDRPSDPRKPMHINGPPRNARSATPGAGPSRPTPPPPPGGFPHRFGPPGPGPYGPMGPYGAPPPGWQPYGAPPPGYWGPDPRFAFGPPRGPYGPYPPQGGWPMYPGAFPYDAAYGPYPGMPPYPMYPQPGQAPPPTGPPPGGLLPPAVVDDRRGAGRQPPGAGERGTQRFDPYQRPESKRTPSFDGPSTPVRAGSGSRKEGASGNYQRPAKGQGGRK